MQSGTPSELSFGARLRLAFGVLLDAGIARRAAAGLSAPVAAPAPSPVPSPPMPAPTAVVAPERLAASGLAVLGALQREGRLLDFLQQELTAHSDEDVGAAARVVHGGCRKWLHQALDLSPAVTESEGASISVPAGFDAQRIRLTGRVAGAPPHRGTVRHGGWVATAVRLPAIAETLDPRVLAPAEVEIE